MIHCSFGPLKNGIEVVTDMVEPEEPRQPVSILTTVFADRSVAVILGRVRAGEIVPTEHILNAVIDVVVYSPRDWSGSVKENEIYSLATGEWLVMQYAATTAAAQQIKSGVDASSAHKLRAIAGLSERLMGTAIDDVDIRQIHSLSSLVE